MAQRKSLASLGSLRDKLDQISNQISSLAIKDVKVPKSQSRRYFDEDKLSQLENSIRTYGVLEPLIVRPVKGGLYELVAGERRLRAAQRAGFTEVPVVVKELNDAEAAKINLIENLQREDLNPFEETEGIVLLLSNELNIPLQDVPPLLHRLQHQCKQTSNNVIGSTELHIVEAIFASIGRMTWKSFVNNRLPLLNLASDVADALRMGKIAYTKAKVISQVKDDQVRNDLLKMTIEEDLSLTEIKNQVKLLQTATNSSSKIIGLKNRVNKAIKALIKSDVWNSTTKQKEVERLLLEIENLLQK